MEKIRPYVMDGNVIKRRKFPRLTIIVEDEADDAKVASALRKCAEFLIKQKKDD